MKIFDLQYYPINIKKIVLLFFFISLPKHAFSQLDLRTCGFNCTSNNYSLNDVFLSLTDVYGYPITNTTCEYGSSNQVFILMNYTSNSNSNIYFTRLFADLYIDGINTPINVNLGTINPGAGQKKIFGPFNWICGQELTLSNILVAWKTNANNNPGTNYSCGNYSSSQCDFSQSMTICRPLSVRFTYKACRVGSQTTVNFNSIISGGIPPYSYAWDFDSNGTIDSTIPNPTHVYLNTNSFVAKLTITDSQGLINSFSHIINFPTELIFCAITTNLDCSENSNGAINLSVSGGNPGYSYLWSNGMITNDISNLIAGNYSVIVTDINGCHKSENYSIANSDVTSPIVTAPADYTINACSENAILNLPFSTSETTISMTQFSQASGNVYDNSNHLTISYIDSKTGSCPIIITRTFKIKDECNNIGIDKQIITILDNIPPTFTAPENITIYSDATCNFDGSPTNTGTVLNASDNCSSNLQATFSDVISDRNCEGSKIITRTWSLADSCGNNAENQTQIITVLDNISPTFTAPENITIYSDATCNFDSSPTNTGTVLNASDNCSSNLQATFSDVISNGVCQGSKIITRTWNLVDFCGNVAENQTQIITILDNIPPTFTAPENITIYSDAICNYDSSPTNTGTVLNASDNCSTNLQATFSDVISDGNCEGSKIITRTWSLADSCGNNAENQTQIITFLDNIPPTFTAPENITIYSDATCNFDSSPTNTGTVLNASDNCSTNLQATFSDVISNGVCQGSKIITRTWNLVDFCGNVAENQTQIITILDNIPPTFTAPENITIYSDATCNFDGSPTNTGTVLNASDNCSTNLQATFSDVISNGVCQGSKIITRTWNLVDFCGNVAENQTQIITILDNIPPTFTAPENITIYSDATCNFDGSPTNTGTVLNASDNCSTNLQATFSDVISNGVCQGSKIITRTWSLADSCGNNAENQTQIITILDNIPPTFTLQIPLNISVSCNAIPAAENLIATDNCSSVSVLYKETKTEGNCVSNYLITRTWTAIDGCENSSFATQIITVNDTEAPTISGDFDSEINVNCNGIPPIPTVNFIDNCSGVGTVIYPNSVDSISNVTENSYTIIREWVVNDLCDNAATFTQKINVTIDNHIVEITHESCNDLEDLINLNLLITADYRGLGNWIDLSNSGGLNSQNIGYFSCFGLPIGNYALEYRVDTGNCPKKFEIEMNVYSDCILGVCDPIVIHNAISPNDDGLNDVFTIENLQDFSCYTSNRVEIYNRWGLLVYETDNYDNNLNAFRGISNGRTIISKSEKLPAGTYFYVLNYFFEEKAYKKEGYLYLSR